MASGGGNREVVDLPAWKIALNKSRVGLCTDLYLLEVLQHLMARDVINQPMTEEIMAHSTKYKQNYEFVTWLLTVSETKFDQFCEVLKCTNHDHIEERIRSLICEIEARQSSAENDKDYEDSPDLLRSTHRISVDERLSGYIVVAGGDDGITISKTKQINCFAYKIASDEWISLPNIGKFISVQIVTCHEKVYVLGVQSRSDEEENTSLISMVANLFKKSDPPAPLDSLQIMRLSMRDWQWEVIPDITVGYYSKKPIVFKTCIVAATMDTKLYVFAKDCDGKFHFDMVDLHWTCQKWKKLACPNEIIESLAVLNGMVYSTATGETDLYNNERCSTCRCQVYDPATNTWNVVASLKDVKISPVLKYNSFKPFAPLVALKDSLFVVGRGDKKGTCERYDLAEEKWIEIKPLTWATGGSAVASDGKNIYAVGGIDVYGEFIKKMEMYNVEEDKWTSFENYPNEICWAASTFVDVLVCWNQA